MTVDHDPSQATSATSRRNFVAGAALLGSTLSLSVMRPSSARATHGPGNSDVNCFKPNPGDGNGHCGLCFLAGTRLATPHGEIAIESLRTRDLVTTAAGEARPIKWLARMRFERLDGEAWGRDVRPVRITAGALDGQTPHRDLRVSGAHLIFVDGVLIPAGDLVNGTSIILEDALDRTFIEYFHVELEAHDILIADGAAAESLQAKSTNRRLFDNYDEFVRLYGANAPDLLPCAPIMGYFGGRGEIASRLRSMIAPIVDVRRPLEIARDRIDNLAERRAA